MYPETDDDEIYGIDKSFAHPRAVELIPEEFFWDCVDELAPFGSDEGDLALAEFRDWRKANPDLPVYECLRWTIESLSEQPLEDYNVALLDRELIKSQIEDREFDDHYRIYVLDICVIATGFGQLVDDGTIDEVNKPLIQLAIDRQKIWAELSDTWDYRLEYIQRMQVLERVLGVA